MNISSTYLSVLVMFLAQVLPKLGIVVGTDALTTTVATLVSIFAGVKILYERHKRGDVGLFGNYK